MFSLLRLSFVFIVSMFFVSPIIRIALRVSLPQMKYRLSAYHGCFFASSSVVYIQYTPFSQAKNPSVLCDPAVNIYCLTCS